jgi:hypothetical protein
MTTPTLRSAKGGPLTTAEMDANFSGLSARIAALEAILSPTAPANTVLPAITGTATVGQVLTCSNGTWTGTPTSYAYQWKRAGSALSGATASTYTLVSGDASTAITCTVTATNAGGSTAATSVAVTVGALVVVAPAISTAPAINGTPQVGVLCSYTAGTYTGSTATLTRQWTLDGTAITGATGATYTPVSGDATHALRVVETATNTAGNSGPNASSPGTVAAATPDTRPRFFVAPANAYSSPGTLIAGGTTLVGSSNGGHAGTFVLTTTSGNYGWLAVEESGYGTGVHVFDGVGFGGWSGAGLSGNNTGSSPDPSTTTTTFTDSNSTTWRLLRQDFINANPSAANYTLS